MQIVIGCDKGGYQLKEAIKKMLIENCHDVMDIGTSDVQKPISHTEAAIAVASALQCKKAQRGILLCGTGMGVAITANKFKGIYAAVVESEFTARYCRLINDCNVLCLGGYILGEYMALEIVRAFIGEEFAKDFVETRKEYLNNQIEQIRVIECNNFK